LFQPDKSICACTALRRWIARAHVKGDWEPVFRPIDRRDVIGTERLSDGAVAETIKKYAKAIGLEPSRFAGHSMRSGFVTEAAVQGVSTSKIMTQTGHRTFEMVQRYVRHADPFEGNATEGMGKVPPQK
jgi:integrase